MATERTSASGGRSRSRAPRIRRFYGAPWLFAAVVVVMVADVATTAVGLELGLREANPLVADIVVRYGVPGMLTMKAVAAGVLLAGPLWAPRPRLTFRASTLLYGLVGAGAVVSNVIHIWHVL